MFDILRQLILLSKTRSNTNKRDFKQQVFVESLFDVRWMINIVYTKVYSWCLFVSDYNYNKMQS